MMDSNLNEYIRCGCGFCGRFSNDIVLLDDLTEDGFDRLGDSICPKCWREYWPVEVPRTMNKEVPTDD